MAFGLLTAGLGFVGGLMDRSQRRKDARANSGVGVRADAEASGFNPLTLLASGARASAGYAPVMGSAMARAGQALTDWSTNEKALEIENARLQMDQQELQTRLEQQTLRPPVAGLYGRTNGTGNNGVQDVQRITEGGESGLPEGDENGLVFGQSAQSDTMYEIESDAYLAAVKANVEEWGTELFNRNFPDYAIGGSYWSSKPKDWFEPIKGGIWSPVDRKEPIGRDPRHDVWRAQNYGPDYNPEGWRR